MNNQWLINKTPRSVGQLRLWAENPRLNPGHEYVRLSDFAESFTHEPSDRKEFLKLVKSIAEDGFVPADPIVVWQKQSNQKYYVAEGNRRVVALKLLRNPEKAPQSIIDVIIQLSSKVNLDDFEKIYVNVAPSFEKAEWYISQRNSTSSLQRKWSNEQQRRWISELYEKYSGNIDLIISKTKQTKPELESTIRLLKIKDYIKLSEVNSKLTDEEYELAKSYRFPMTVLERFFSFSDAKEAWGLEYDGINVDIISSKESFYNAFAELIKQIIAKEINTRLTKDDLPDILNKLPYVSFENVEGVQEKDDDLEDTLPHPVVQPTHPSPNINTRTNPDRVRLIPGICKLKTSNHKLNALFNELKSSPFARNHSISVVLRVFFDLSVLEYINLEGIEGDILKQFHQKKLKDINLKKRLEYIKQNQLLNVDASRAISKLLNPNKEHYSLDTLNGYIHSDKTHYSDKRFLNGFWDFLYPMFESLLDIKEE